MPRPPLPPALSKGCKSALGPGMLGPEVQEGQGEPGLGGSGSPWAPRMGLGGWRVRKAAEGYLGGSPGARRSSPAEPPASVAHPRWGRLPTGSASSRGRRRPLAGRGRGRVHTGTVGHLRPVGRSGAWRSSPVAQEGEMGAERGPEAGKERRKEQVRLPTGQMEPRCRPYLCALGSYHLEKPFSAEPSGGQREP